MRYVAIVLALVVGGCANGDDTNFRRAVYAVSQKPPLQLPVTPIQQPQRMQTTCYTYGNIINCY